MKRPLQILLSIAVSALFVWLSLRGAPLSEVWDAVLRADLRWVALYFVFLTGVHLVRVARWGLLLEPVAKVRFRDLNPIGAVGFMALMVLPLRLGELARPYLVGEQLGVRKTAALASVVVERLIDGASMGLLLVVLLWTVPQADAPNFEVYRVGAGFVTAAFAGGLVFLFFAFRHRELANRLLRRSLGLISTRLADKAATMLDAFTDALQVVPSWRRAGELLAFTAMYWALGGLGLKVMAEAFGFSLDVPQAFTVLGLQVLGAMIPTGPGMTGPIQFVTIKGVELFTGTGIHAAVVAFAHAVWATQFLQQLAFGMAYVVTGRVRLDGIWARLRTGEPVSPAAQ